MTDQAIVRDDGGAVDETAPETDAVQPVRLSRVKRVNTWLRQRTIPQIAVAAMVLLWTAYFTQRSLDIHHGLAFTLQTHRANRTDLAGNGQALVQHTTRCA